MDGFKFARNFLVTSFFSILLISCVYKPAPQPTFPDGRPINNLPLYHGAAPFSAQFNEQKYAARMPQQIDAGSEKVIIVNPRIYAWGAYDATGQLVKAGIAASGADYCTDIKKACRTKVGTFRIYSLGDETCVSRTYPIGKGGSLMPYCMFFYKGLSLHGSPDQMLAEMNTSHGCVHMRIPDIEWLRYNFVKNGTKVIILPY
jgi:lipoprotein-anchoring transpeptidase ErfK/SrfK